MSALVKRIEQLLERPYIINKEMKRLEGYKLEGSVKHWLFATELTKPSVEFYYFYLKQYLLLTLEYDFLSTYLTREFKLRGNTAQYVDEIVALLKLCELLIYLYQNYINTPHEVYRLQQDQMKLRAFLTSAHQFKFSSAEIISIERPSFFVQEIKAETGETGPWRLMLVRGKRILNNLAPLINNASYTQFSKILDMVLNPIFSYLSWLFFFPRLFSNLFVVFKHSVPGSWFALKEHELFAFFRLDLVLQKRWFELGNDSVWYSLGVAACFFLGAPIAVYFAFAAYVFDIFWAMVRIDVEEKPLKGLLDVYQKFNLDPEEKSSMTHQSFMAYFEKRIEAEKKRFHLTYWTALGICACFILMLPILSVNPIIPFVGAALFFVCTVLNFIYARSLNKERANERISFPSQTQASFFYQKETARSTPSSLDLSKDNLAMPK